MKQHYFKKAMAVFLSFTTISVLADDVVTTLPATDITQTKATLQAEFIEGSTSNGFEYKYGTIPELDDFASLLLTETSDPVTFTQGTKAWRAVNSRGWVESYYDNTSTSLTSDISTQFTVTEATPVTFEWSVSSQENVGKLQFLVDGTVVQSITGEVDFVAVSYELPAGQHTLKWQYKRSTTESIGDGIGKLRHLTIHNTTEGEWLNWPATSNTARLEYLYPSQNYLFRAYSTIGEKKVYSSIRQFRSLGISLGTPRVVSTTQTTATVECDVDAGDAEVDAMFYIKSSKTRSVSCSMTSFQQALFLDNSDIVVVNSGSFNYGSGYVCPSTWNSSSSFSFDVTVTTQTTLSFEYSVCNGYVWTTDNGSNYLQTNTTVTGKNYSGTFSMMLTKGTHKIVIGATPYQTANYSAKISKLFIENASNAINRQTTILNDTIIVPVNSSVVNSLFTNLQIASNNTFGIIILPSYSSILPKKWPVIQKDHDSSFSTLPVLTKKITIINKTQTSAKICALFESGDATISSKGVHYRVKNSSTWIKSHPNSEGADSVCVMISNLAPSTTYEVRSYINPEGEETIYSEVYTFKTSEIGLSKPILDFVSEKSAIIRGVTNPGDASYYERGIQLREKDGIWTTFCQEDKDTIIINPKGLCVNTEYEARTYLDRVGGILYSEILSFKTDNILVKVDSIVTTQTTATMYVHASFGDDNSETIEEFGRSCQCVCSSGSSYSGMTSDSLFVKTFSGLIPDSTYTFSFTLTNSKEEKVSADGILSARTKSVELFIDSISDVYQRSAIVHGRMEMGDAIVEESYINANVYDSEYSTISTYKFPFEPCEGVIIVPLNGISTNSLCSAEMKLLSNSKVFGSKDSLFTYSTVASSDSDILKALCSPESGSDISASISGSSIIIGNGEIYNQWNSGVSGYVYVSLYLKEDTQISFEWFCTGKESRGGITTYNLCTFSVDGAEKARISSSSTSSHSYKTLTYVLKAGNHKLTWFLGSELSGSSGVRNLFISPNAFVPKLNELAPSLFKTTGFLDKVEASNVTQTTATLQANIIPTNEEGMEYYFSPNKSEKTWQDIEEEFGRLSDEEKEKYWYEWGYDIEVWAAETDAWHNNERIPTSVKDSVFNADLVNLEPDTEYTYYAVAKTSDDQKYEEKIQFKTLPVGISITVSNITQTTAVVNVSTDSGTATISNLQYNIDNGEWKALSNYVITLTGLTPNNSYRVNLRWDVNGKTYNNYVTLKTASVNVYAASVTAAQTSALLRMGSLSVGTATKTASGIVFEGETYSLNPNDTIRLKELKPATNYTYTYFVDTEEGGRVSNIGKFNTTAITAVTLPVTNISNRSATLNGTIDCDDHSSAEFGFQWKEKTGWTTDPRFTKGRKGDDGNISVALVNGMLKPDTEYEYRTAVRYQGQIYYAPTWSDFRTELEYVYYPATAYTIFRTDSENNRLILCGYYLAGSEQVLSQGYQYWQTNSWESRSLTSDNTQVNTIVTDSTMLAELDLATLNNGVYQVRAFVNTENETVYGQTLSFQVGQAPDAIIEAKMSNPECFVQRRTIVLSHVKGLYATVADLTGRIYWSGISNNESLQVPLSSGVYLVHLNSGHTFKVQVR